MSADSTTTADPRGAGGLTTRVRAFLLSPSFDVVLAVIGLAFTQWQLTKVAGGWSLGAPLVQLLLTIAPALIAIRRVDPVLASAGLVGGTYVSTLLGGIDFVLLAGSVLALWSLASRCSKSTAVLAGLVITSLPLVLRSRWGGFEITFLRSSNRLAADDPYWDMASSTITPAQYSQMLAMKWPWWLSIVLLAFCLLGVLYRVLRRRSVVERALRQRLDDVRGFVLTTAALDAVLAMMMTSLILWELGRDVGKGNWWTAPGWMPNAIAFAALTLVLRRRWPVVPVVVLATGALLTYWQTSESWTVLAALAIALYSLAANWRIRYSLPVAIGVLTALPVLAALVRYPQLVLVFPQLTKFLQWDEVSGRDRNFVYEGIVDQQWPALLSLALALPVLGGVLIRLYRRNRETAARELELERRSEEQVAARVVLTERSHIARDLHDVVAHAVNLMVIQAETGPDLLLRGDREVLDGFQRIGDTGRRALGELDRLLSALRDADGVPDPQLAPQPGLAEIRQLVRDVSHERLAVDLELTGDTSLPPAGHQLTAYRLVQEALTNVARHAEATWVKVEVRIGKQGIAVMVTDDGAGFDIPAARSRGRHGLAGMRERVRIHSGKLEIRSSPGSGTEIEAWLPVTGEGQKLPEAIGAVRGE